MTPSAPERPRTPVAAVVAARRSQRERVRRRRRLAVLWTVVAVLVGSGAFAAGLLAAPIDFSSAPVPPKSALLLDAKGRLFATLRSPETLEEVPAAKIPRVMRLAIVAAEDERFFQHQGVDPFGVLRAAYRDISGRHLQGGSTITQQYVKNVYVGSERTPLRKVREAALAIRLEQKLSKDEILTRYLNSLYLGNGTYGVQAASKFYFGVPVQDLDLDPATGQRSDDLALARAATMAGMAPAPSAWNPLASKKAARERELYTLNRMLANQLISTDQASAAYGHSLPRVVARSAADLPTVAPQFRDMVSQELRSRYSDDELFRSGGLRVRTSLDLDLQKAANSALQQVLPAKDDPWAVIAAVDPRTGDIRAVAQKTDRPYVKDGLNLAYIARSSGSTIKPFTLARALMDGHTLDEGAYGPPCVTRPYKVCNSEDYEGGYFSLRTALEQSINTVYGPLAVKLGVKRVFQLAYDAGMRPAKTLLAKTVYPAQSIGIEVHPLSEASAFGTLVDHGIRREPRTLLEVRSDSQGSLYQAPASAPSEQVIPAKVADQVAEAMRGVVDHGTGTAARQSFPVFGKTGTTDNFTNAWFTGCTPELCIAVWMGYDQEYVKSGGQIVPHEMRGVEGVDKVYGGTLPAAIFAKVWDDYRALQAPKPTPSASPTPGPVTTTFAPPPPVRPVPNATTSRAPTPKRTAAPRAPSATPPPQHSSSPPPPIPIGPSPTSPAAAPPAEQPSPGG